MYRSLRNKQPCSLAIPSPGRTTLLNPTLFEHSSQRHIRNIFAHLTFDDNPANSLLAHLPHRAVARAGCGSARAKRPGASESAKAAGLNGSRPKASCRKQGTPRRVRKTPLERSCSFAFLTIENRRMPVLSDNHKSTEP